MSKKNDEKAIKKIKTKANGFDIMYRAVTAVLAIAIFPVVYFMNLVYYAFNSTGSSKLVNNLTDILTSDSFLDGLKNFFSPILNGDTNQGIEITEGYICLAKLDELKKLIENIGGSGDKGIKELLVQNPLLRPVAVSAVLLAVVLVLAVVILIVSIIKAKPKVIAILSGIGTTLMIIADAIFIIGFANPVVKGEMSLDQVIHIDSFLGSIALQLIGTAMEIRLDNAFFTVMFLMLAIFIWSLSVMIVNAGDKEYKKEAEIKKAKKKAKKAERKAKKEKKKAKKAKKQLKKEIKEEKKQEKEEKKQEKEEKKQAEKEAEKSE